MGIEVKNNFILKYIIICGKGFVLKDLKLVVKKVKKVYFVVDLDCEGEVIVWYLVNMLNVDVELDCWVVFNEIMKDVIKELFKYFCVINMDLVDV